VFGEAREGFAGFEDGHGGRSVSEGGVAEVGEDGVAEVAVFG